MCTGSLDDGEADPGTLCYEQYVPASLGSGSGSVNTRQLTSSEGVTVGGYREQTLGCARGAPLQEGTRLARVQVGGAEPGERGSTGHGLASAGKCGDFGAAHGQPSAAQAKDAGSSQSVGGIAKELIVD